MWHETLPMNARLALQRLWWKELRQLMPMLVLLPTLVLLLLVFYQFVGLSSISANAIPMVILGMPGLFAVGAGALLVGHEKELRTLDWLSSLPIAATSIVRVKLGAGLLGLLALWLLAGLLFTFTAVSSSYVPLSGADTSWVNWPLNSLFVLLAGFALAWWTRSALLAVLLVVPVSISPYALAIAIDSIALWHTTVSHKPSPNTLLVCQVLCSGVALWLVDRLGRQSLAPQSPSSVMSPRLSAIRSWFPARDRYRTQHQLAGYGKVQAPLPALVWQFVCQSRAWLLGTSMMLAAAVLLTASTNLLTASTDLGQRQASPMLLVVLLGFLATSWLGTSVFQSDTIHQRIRFLADRGISPRLIWLTRHAAPAGILALFILLLVVIVAITTRWDATGLGANYRSGSFTSSTRWDRTVLGSTATAFGLTAAAIAVIYLVSQWVGQVILSPIVSTVAAPFIVLGAIGYGSFSLNSLGTPWWVAALVLLIPIAATIMMTRRWMDRRLGFSYWASHAGFLGAVAFIPWIPLLITAARQPAMPAVVAAELNAAHVKSRAYRVAPHELVLGETKHAGEAFVPIEDHWDRQLDDFENQLRETSRPISASSFRVFAQLRSIATLTRLSLEQGTTSVGQSPAAGDGPSAQQQSLQLYQRSVGLLVRIAERMRLSPRIIEQDTADLIEIWLLAELKRVQAAERLGEPLYSTAASMLADQAARREARARSVALSWASFQEENRLRRHPSMTLGGYDLHDVQSDVGTMRGGLLNNRRVGLAVSDLWQWVNEGEQSATPERLVRIAQFWGRPPSDYGIGPVGIYRRADDLDRFIHPGFRSFAVASQWFAGWEREAAELLEP